MGRVRRLLVSLVSVAMAASVGLAPSASAQEGCTLLTVPEVEAALGVTGVTETGASSFCTFSDGTASLYVVVQPGSDLASQRRLVPRWHRCDRGRPVRPGPRRPAAQSCVELPGQVVGISYIGEKAWAETLPILTGLLELAVPRVPAGPSPEDVARLSGAAARDHRRPAHHPAGVQGRPAAGVHGPDGGAGDRALNEALADQGQTAADVLLVGRETDDPDNEDSVVAVLAKGADASQAPASRCSGRSHPARRRPRSRPSRSVAGPPRGSSVPTRVS